MLSQHTFRESKVSPVILTKRFARWENFRQQTPLSTILELFCRFFDSFPSWSVANFAPIFRGVFCFRRCPTSYRWRDVSLVETIDSYSYGSGLSIFSLSHRLSVIFQWKHSIR